MNRKIKNGKKMSFCFSYPDYAPRLSTLSSELNESLRASVSVDFVKWDKRGFPAYCSSCEKPIEVSVVYSIHIGNSYYTKDSETIHESRCANCFVEHAQLNLKEFSES